MSIYKKLQQCRLEIKKGDTKKKGKNSFSKYDYYTPDQVSQIVFTVCQKNDIFTKFDLRRDELGVFGVLLIVDIESGESTHFEMASAIPEIKATNAAQQLGGAMTYTERYLLMTAFDIKDNNLDFDTTENTKQVANPKKPVKPELTPDHEGWSKAVKYVSDGNPITDIEKKYRLSPELKNRLQNESETYNN
jgi:hypothetical protein